MMQEMRAPNRCSSGPLNKGPDEHRFGARISCIMAPSLANPRGKLSLYEFCLPENSKRIPSPELLFKLTPGQVADCMYCKWCSATDLPNARGYSWEALRCLLPLLKHEQLARNTNILKHIRKAHFQKKCYLNSSTGPTTQVPSQWLCSCVYSLSWSPSLRPEPLPGPSAAFWPLCWPADWGIQPKAFHVHRGGRQQGVGRVAVHYFRKHVRPDWYQQECWMNWQADPLVWSWSPQTHMDIRKEMKSTPANISSRPFAFHTRPHTHKTTSLLPSCEYSKVAKKHIWKPQLRL